MRANRLLKWLIFLAFLLALTAGLLFTPLGPRLSRGAAGLWQAFANLPGIAWARERMAATPAPAAETGATGSAGSDAIRETLQAGMALQEEGKPEEALRRYREALAQDESYAATHASLASAYLQLGREEDALRELERAAELAPDNGYILGQLGRLYLQRDDYDKSIATLLRAREAEPDEAKIRSWLGAAYYYRSHADALNAVVELEKAVQLAPKDAETHFQLALAYMQRDQSGDQERAIASLEQVLALDSAQTEPYYYLGLLYARAGRRDEAIAAWRRYVSASDDKESVAKVRTWLRSLEEGQGPTPESVP